MSTTLKDIARECRVDVATVSRSLNNEYGVRQETRKRVLTVAARLKYRPNRLARGLATGRSRTLALVVSDIRNPFFAQVARGAEDAAFKRGYDLLLCNSDLDSTKQMHYFRSLLEKRVEGIIMNSVATLSRTFREELSRCGVPVVLLNRPPRASGISTVLADNYEGGRLAGDYLIQLGHRVIAHLTGPRQHGNLAERTKGFLKAAESTRGRVTAILSRGHHSSEGGYKMMKKLLSEHPKPSAVFAGNDAVAFGVIRAVFDAGLNVPEDVSVIGFDNVELASIIRPPLTTIDQPKYEMGWAAVEILLRHAERPASWAPENRLFGVKLVERESCRPL